VNSPAVKNTFIHFSFDDQPDYVPAKSGPAKLIGSIGADSSSPAFKIAFTEDSPAASLSSSAANTPAIGAAEPIVVGKPGAGEEGLASRGSAGHASGTCKACAHIWKPGGCAKGYDCTFCHVCDEDDFKRRRKEKLTRMKAERVRRRSELDGPGGGSPGSEASPSSAAATPLHLSEDPGSPGASRGRFADAALEAAPDAGGELAAGEMSVEYDHVGAHISWAVDARRLRAQSRCGLSRRFSLQLFGSEVPFVLFVVPGDAEALPPSRLAPGRKAQQPPPLRHATMQLKCADPAPLAGHLLRVAFSAGSLPPRQASDSHDFLAEPCCVLPPKDSLWDISGSAASSRIVFHVEVQPGA